MFFYAFIWFLIRPIESCGSSQCKETSSVKRYRLDGHVLFERRAETMQECVQTCNHNQACLSVNYKFLDLICELNKADVHIAPHSYVPAKGYVYSDNPWPKVKIVRANMIPLRPLYRICSLIELDKF